MSAEGVQLEEDDFIEVSSPSGWVPLSYVEDEGSIFLLASGNNARWCTHLLRSGNAMLRISGRLSSGSASLETDVELRERVLSKFKSKYGALNFEKWFGRPGRLVRIDLRSRGSGMAGDNYYSWLESEFDVVASDYDRHITENSVNMLLRERSLWLLGRTFSRPSRLLEVGCGSGMETLPMLRKGHEIVAIDISSSMIEVVRRKAKSEGLAERLTAVKLRAGELGRLLADGYSGSFDGCYSTYGALNCEISLDNLPEVLHSLLRHGGKFVAGIFNKYCMVEGLAYAMTLRPARALRRLRNPIEEGNSRFCVDVYSYTPHEFSAIFSQYFMTERIFGVPVIFPPSDLDSYARKFSGRHDSLKRMDFWLAGKWPFNHMGDHFLVTMARRDAVDVSVGPRAVMLTEPIPAKA